MVERKVEGTKIPQVVVSSTRHKIADIADRFYSCPSKGINLIGVTGTNGKTTVTHLIQKIFEENNEKCALIGTLGYKLSSNGEYRDVAHPIHSGMRAVLEEVILGEYYNVLKA